MRWHVYRCINCGWLVGLPPERDAACLTSGVKPEEHIRQVVACCTEPTYQMPKGDKVYDRGGPGPKAPRTRPVYVG